MPNVGMFLELGHVLNTLMQAVALRPQASQKTGSRIPFHLRERHAHAGAHPDEERCFAGVKMEPTKFQSRVLSNWRAPACRVLDVEICECNSRPEARSSIDTAASLCSSKESATQMVLYGPVVTCGGALARERSVAGEVCVGSAAPEGRGLAHC